MKCACLVVLTGHQLKDSIPTPPYASITKLLGLKELCESKPQGEIMKTNGTLPMLKRGLIGEVSQVSVFTLEAVEPPYSVSNGPIEMNCPLIISNTLVSRSVVLFRP